MMDGDDGDAQNCVC